MGTIKQASMGIITPLWWWLSLGVQINDTGLGLWIGQSLVSLKTVPLIILVMAVAALIIFSNRSYQ